MTWCIWCQSLAEHVPIALFCCCIPYLGRVVGGLELHQAVLVSVVLFIGVSDGRHELAAVGGIRIITSLNPKTVTGIARQPGIGLLSGPWDYRDSEVTT